MGAVKKVRTNIYLNLEVKEEARKILERYGLSLSDAVNIFLTQVTLERGFPFHIRIPNEETKRVLEEIERGENLEDVALEELISEAKTRVRA
jgi:DNA-damage-inducible protein J